MHRVYRHHRSHAHPGPENRRRSHPDHLRQHQGYRRCHHPDLSGYGCRRHRCLVHQHHLSEIQLVEYRQGCRHRRSQSHENQQRRHHQYQSGWSHLDPLRCDQRGHRCLNRCHENLQFRHHRYRTDQDLKPAGYPLCPYRQHH